MVIAIVDERVVSSGLWFSCVSKGKLWDLFGGDDLLGNVEEIWNIGI